MNDKKNREPMVIALATGKGGSMKTTSAVFLACALVDQSRGEQHVLVADADVQGDAKDWWYRAAELDDPLPFDVMSAAPADIAHLHGINGRLDDPVDWVLIDAADIACFETLIPKRQDILNAKSTRPRGSRLHEYRDLSGELKQTMRQLKGEDL